MDQNGATFHTHRNRILPYYPKETLIFPYLRQYHSTPSFLSNPDKDSYQDISASPQSESETLFDSFNPRTSIRAITQPKSTLYSGPHHQNLPSSTSQNDTLDNTFNSTDSDFEMLQNPLYHSNSFPRFYPLVAASPNFLSESSPNSQTLLVHNRVPHSPYN